MTILRRKVTWPQNERKYFDEQDLAQLAETKQSHGVIENDDGYIGVSRTFGHIA